MSLWWSTLLASFIIVLGNEGAETADNYIDPIDLDEHLEEIFAEFDHDKDGLLSIDEAAAWIKLDIVDSDPEELAEDIREEFSELDETDHLELANAFLEEVDDNKDGMFSRSELRKIIDTPVTEEDLKTAGAE